MLTPVPIQICLMKGVKKAKPMFLHAHHPVIKHGVLENPPLMIFPGILPSRWDFPASHFWVVWPEVGPSFWAEPGPFARMPPDVGTHEDLEWEISP